MVARWIVLAVAPLLYIGTPAEAAYRFVRIIDTSGTPSSLFTTTAINDSGRVAFVVSDPSGEAVLYTGRGGPLTKIADTTGELASFGAPDINRWGTVAFQAFLDENVSSPGTLEATATGIFAGNGQTLKTLARYTDRASYFLDAAINDKGQVTSVVQWATGASSVVTYSPNRTIASFTKPGNFFGTPDINNSGVIAFDTTTNTSVQRIVTGTGGKLTTRATTQGTDFMLFSPPRINDSGMIAFDALLDSGGNGIFISDSRGARTIADTTGPFRLLGSPDINNTGSLAFLAFLDAGPRGIFTGPNPVTDRVIVEGDPLDGSVVKFLFATRRSLNNAGQIAFYAELTDGRLGIYRADPVQALASAAVPEPATWLLLAICALVIRVRRAFRDSMNSAVVWPR